MKPLLLDVFCGAGGAAMGYHRAGFDIVGVDLEPQPNYPFPFVQTDALAVLRGLERLAWAPDAIHASPPCQAHSALAAMHPNNVYPDLIPETRELLRRTGRPYVIENVVGAPLREPFKLCGSSFGLRVRRHRLFETNWPIGLLPSCSHNQHPAPIEVCGHGGRSERHRKPLSLDDGRNAMGIGWMSRYELSQAIPPAYTEYIGRELAYHALEAAA